MDNDSGKLLHDRATRGEELSDKEQIELDAWYATQDGVEDALLAGTGVLDSIATLQAQVSGAVAQLLVITRRIQELAAQNDMERQTIAGLQQQLAQARSTRAA